MIIVSEFNDVFSLSESINIYNNGNKNTYFQGSAPYNAIIEGWQTLIKNAHEMPAFGVSLNWETVSAMQTGLWAEFVFDKQQIYNEMPFEKLLINVEKQWTGFNIIRFNSEEGYSGRCYYFDLVDRNMSDFYNILLNL